MSVTKKQNVYAPRGSPRLSGGDPALHAEKVAVHKQNAHAKQRETILKLGGVIQDQAIHIAAHGTDIQIRPPRVQARDVGQSVPEEEDVAHVRVKGKGTVYIKILPVGIRKNEKTHKNLLFSGQIPLSLHIMATARKKRGMFMKFDPNAMAALLSLDDASLWEKITSIAAGSGVTLSRTTPPPEEMKKLRALMGGAGQADVANAMATLARYKRGNG